MWLKLHARMVALICGFTQTVVACKKKFNAIYKQYKEDKIAIGILGNDRHECRFCESMEQWWHQNGNVMKHITASANDSSEPVDNPEFSTKPKEDNEPTIDEVRMSNKRNKTRC